MCTSLVLCLIWTEQVVAVGRIFGWVGLRHWSEDRWTERTKLGCRVCMLVRTWNVEIDLAGWRD